MSGNYPPGVHAGTPNAPWNEDPLPTCSECGCTIDRGDDHEDDCIAWGEDAQDIAEHRESATVDMEYERQREKEMFNNE